MKIERVTRRTDAGNYFGELGVMEAEGASEMNYMQTISMGIRLEVYGEHYLIIIQNYFVGFFTLI